MTDQQGQSKAPALAVSAPLQTTLPFPAPAPSRSRVWLRRCWLILYILFCLDAGMILLLAPWQRGWGSTPLLLSVPWLQNFLLKGFVRGVISGIGLINLWMGFWSAVTYKEDRPSRSGS